MHGPAIEAGGGFGAFGGPEPTGSDKPFSFGSAQGSTSSFSFAPPAQNSGFPLLQNVFGGLNPATTPLFGAYSPAANFVLLGGLQLA